MSGEVCGKPWCSVKHKPSGNPRRMHECASLWRSDPHHSNPMLMMLRSSGYARLDQPAVVFVDIIGKLRESWSQAPRGFAGTGAVLPTSDLRAMAAKLIEVADWADREKARRNATAQDLRAG